MKICLRWERDDLLKPIQRLLSLRKRTEIFLAYFWSKTFSPLIVHVIKGCPTFIIVKLRFWDQLHLIKAGVSKKGAKVEHRYASRRLLQVIKCCICCCLLSPSSTWLILFIYQPQFVMMHFPRFWIVMAWIRRQIIHRW